MIFSSPREKFSEVKMQRFKARQSDGCRLFQEAHFVICSQFTQKLKRTSAFSPDHNTEGWHRTLSTFSSCPTSSGAATWNELTWTFFHTSGSEAVFSFRVHIHLVSGGVIQDQWGTCILARCIIPKLAARLSWNNSTHYTAFSLKSDSDFTSGLQNTLMASSASCLALMETPSSYRDGPSGFEVERLLQAGQWSSIFF